MKNFDYLPKLHNCQLIIAREIKRICDENNIKYFIIAGTLLGAIRHGGFIPWDDDMDIGMLREDYEKFINIAKTDLGEDFFLQTPETDYNYGLTFAKILLKGTVLVEETTASNNAQKGIFVDIFPFDVAPESESDRESHNKKTYFYKRLLLAKLNYNIAGKREYVKRMIYFILKIMSKFFSREKLEKKLDDEITRYNSQKTDDIVNIGGAYGYKKETIKASWVRKTVEIPFEDMTIAAPIDYIKYLETFYGDYMTPPPEDKRYNRHSIKELDFGKYAD